MPRTVRLHRLRSSRDHALGTTAFVTREDARSGTDPIFAHDAARGQELGRERHRGGAPTIRSAHMFGAFLSGDDVRDTNAGLGPPFLGGPSGFLAPNRTFTHTLDATVAGVRTVKTVHTDAIEEVVRMVVESLIEHGEAVPGGPTDELRVSAAPHVTVTL